MPKDTGIGAATVRREDVRFLTGTGEYTDDIQLAKQTYAVFARSTVAHGTIKSIDTSAAEAMPGVLAVFHRRGFRRSWRQPGWLADQFARWRADERTQAPGTCPWQGAPCG